MPTYTYRCDQCDIVFDKFHSMSETVEACESCGSKVKRQLGSLTNIRRPASRNSTKPGSIVKKHIEEMKQDLKQERERIKKQEYEAK